MPRKKAEKKFKYTVRKNGVLYVRLRLPELKNPVWRICKDETQTAVDQIIEEIRGDHRRAVKENETPSIAKDFFAFCLNRIRGRRAAQRTIEKYETVIRLYLEPEMGHLELADVRRKHFENIYARMTARGLAPLTIRKVHSVASTLFNEAVKLDLIAKNPVKGASAPRAVALHGKTRHIAPQDIQKFFAACQAHTHGFIFEFALETGLRPQEYLALRWTDIDIKRKTVSVSRALVYDRRGGGFYFKEPKTVRSNRTIPISAELTAKLIQHQEKQEEYLSEVENRIHRRAKPSREYRRQYNETILKNHMELNLVFPSQDGTPLKDINIGRRYFKAIIKTAGLDASLVPYSLRHSCATLLLSANVNPKIVSERLGHSSVSITLDIYSHVLPDMQEKATEALSEILYK